MKTTWDYTEHAKYYSARPNYAEPAIDELVDLVGARTADDFWVADIGAGTANLTVMLLARGMNCIAVEPNAEMRKVGMARTEGTNIKWRIGTGEATGLDDESVDWVTMGSSFNTMDRPNALHECHRILKPGGFFTCMWNHRDLNDAFQKEIETLIREMIPSYTAGTRREDQTEIMLQSGLFENVHFRQASYIVTQPQDAYIDGWRSTRNLTVQAGDRLDALLAEISRRVEEHGPLRMKYTTRSWTARKVS